MPPTPPPPQQANLRTKQTHSTQTGNSHFRRENVTQTYAPKDQSTQVKKDQGTSVPKPATYIAGLRGPRGAKAKPVEVVDLTLAIGGVSMQPTRKKK